MASSFTLANMPHVMRNSRHSDTATMWFDIVDSQSGATAKRLIGTTFQFGSALCMLQGPTPVSHCVNTVDAGATPPRPVAHRPRDARSALVPIRRPTIANLQDAARETPWQSHPNLQPHREPHAHMPHNV
jgi:hypothetical protein